MNSSLVRSERGRGRQGWTRSVARGRSRSFVAVLSVGLLWAALTVPMPRPAASAGPVDVSFVALGEAGSGTPGQAALRDVLAGQTASFDLALFLGDNAGAQGTGADYAENVFAVYGSLFQAQGQPLPSPGRGIPKPAYAIAGDRELASEPDAGGFASSFVLPENGPRGLPAERFYSFDAGRVHFVAFDSQIAVDPDTTEAQRGTIRSWLIADLDAHTAQVTVVYLHDAPYGATNAPATEPLRTTWFPLFATHGVDVVLGAHERAYERNRPLSGITSYIVGTAGTDPEPVVPAPYTAVAVPELTVLAVDISGCTISTRALRPDGTSIDPWTFTAPTCSASTGRGERFADGFETADFSAWSTVQVGPGGSAVVERDTPRAGHIARFASSGVDGSYAYARKVLPSPTGTVSVAGDFRVVAEGPSGANVPLVRAFDDTGARILSLYRQNAAASKLYLQHGGRFNTTTGVLPLETWGHVEVRLNLNGGSTAIEVRLNGSLIYQTTSAEVAGQTVARVQIGNDTVDQAFALLVDDIIVNDLATPNPAPSIRPAGPSAGGATPPASPSPEPSVVAPSPSSTPRTILDEGFESGTLRTWTVATTGDGVARAERGTVAAGVFAAHLSAGAGTASSATIRQSLGQPQPAIRFGATILVRAEGPAGGNVPLIRLYDAARNRVISVHRQNANADRVYVSYGGVTYLTTGSVEIGRWAKIELRLVEGPNGRLVELTIDGVVAYSRADGPVRASSIATFQFGNETRGQPFDLFVDETVVRLG